MTDESKSVSRQTSAHSAANALLDLGFFSQAEPPDGLPSSPQEAGDFIGRYRLVAPLGEGGFGLVWQAEQTEPILRELALKLIKPGLNSREIISRFEAERQALALMDHPNIAAVLDAGTTADGRPYFAMELVKGEPITTYCDRHRLGIDERLALFIPVCRAVQHAHQKSILHRDLKPTNILVATVDGQPVSKVIDFGIAKALVGNESPGLADQVRTQMGVAIGTPRYMSPEQAGSRPDVDTRSDIYSLGVVLCELLTGQSPHPAQPTEFLDALRWIRESDPVKPSTLAQSTTAATKEAAERRGTDSRRLARRLRGDLDWITLKALEKDRALRYETATALARDLERHLAEDTVSAVAPTWRYQFGKFARRRRGALIAASLVVAALVAGTVVSLWQASQAKQSRAEAERRYAQARDAVDKYLVRVTDNPKLNQSDFVDLQRELLDTAMPFYEDLSRYRGDDPKLRADRAWALGNLADISQHVGKSDQAEAACRKAIEDLAKLANQFPQDGGQQLRLGQRQDMLAQVLRSRGKLDEALAEQNEAVKTMEALNAHRPDHPDYQLGLAQVFNNRAVILDSLHHDQAAEESRKLAKTIGEKLTSRNPGVLGYWLTLATATAGEADLLRRQQRYLEEVSKRRRAVECYEAAAKAKPDWRVYRELLAKSRGNLGKALAAANQPSEAVPVLRKAVEELQATVDEFPTFKSCRESLVHFQRELTRNLIALQQDAEADAVLAQVLVNHERLVRDFPGESRYAQELAQEVAYENYRAKLRQNPAKAPEVAPRGAVVPLPKGDSANPARTGSSSGKYADTVKRAYELAKLGPSDWESLEAAAEGMAGAAQAIRADDQLSVEARGEQAEDCAAHAVEFLKQAIDKGYTGISYFNTLPCAKALQLRPEYQELLVRPIKPPAQGPRAFRFDYPFTDPGPRKWVREGLTWTETQPSGAKNVYVISGRTIVNGMPGAKLQRMGTTPQTCFIPDLEPGKTHYMWIRQKAGWGYYGPNTDVE